MEPKTPYDEWSTEEKARWMLMTSWKPKDTMVRIPICLMKKSHIENTIMWLFKSGFDIPYEFYRVLRIREDEEIRAARQEAKIMPPHIKQAQLEKI